MSVSVYELRPPAPLVGRTGVASKPIAVHTSEALTTHGPMSTELRSLAAAMLAHQVVGPRPLDTPDDYQRARFMVAGVLFGLYYRGSSYVFSWFAKQGTSPLTSQPTTALVTAGPYAPSRNPALLLVWIFHTAVAVAFNSWWPLLVALPLTYAYLMLITVPNEEEELEKLFGRQFREYKQQTPRYLIPHSCAPDSTLQLAHFCHYRVYNVPRLPLYQTLIILDLCAPAGDWPGSAVEFAVTTLAAEATARPLLSMRMLAIATTVKLRPRDRRRRLRQLLSRSQCDVVRPKKLTVCGRCFLSAGTNPPCARWAASQLQQSTQGTERQCPCCVLFPRA